MMYYTYLHRRADDLKPFYIGKGKGDRAYRKNHRNPHWHRTVLKHGLVVEVLAKWPTEAEAFEHEKFLIKCFRECGHGLANMSDGGEGQSGWMPSEETRRRISEAKTGKPSPHKGKRLFSDEARVAMSAINRGRILTDEHKAKISAAIKGRPKTQQHREKISAGNMGRAVSDETRKKISEAHLRNHCNKKGISQ